MENKIVTAIFKDSTHTKVSDVWQYDYGQILRIQGLDLPTAVEVDFAVAGSSESIARIGTTKDGVTDVVIPDSLIETGKNLVAYIYLRDSVSGNTEYQIDMLVTKRAKPEAYDRPEDKELFGQAIEAVNTAADRAEKAGQTAQEAAQKAGLDAEQTAQDRVEVAKMVETVADISEQVKKVEDLSNKAQAAATKTEADAQQTAEDRVEVGKILETVKDVSEQVKSVEESVKKAKESEQAAEGHRTAVEEMKNSVEQTASGITQVVQTGVQEINSAKQSAVQEVTQTGTAQKTAVEGAGTQAVESVENVKQTATTAVETVKTEAVQAVQTEGNTQTRNVTAEGTKQVKAVQDKGNEVLQSIPEDFQMQMESKLDKQHGVENKGKALVIGEDGNVAPGEVQSGGGDGIAIINTMSGESPLVIPDSAERTLERLELGGKTEQVQTTGKNLFDFSNLESGRINISTGALEEHNHTRRLADYINITDITSYSIYLPGYNKANGAVYVIIYYYDKDKNYLSYKPCGDKIEKYENITPVENAVYIKVTLEQNTIDNPQNIFKVQLEKGAKSTAYEPYTGGKPSPSPEYPQEIKNSGKWNEETQKYEVDVKVTGKNLFDKDSVKKGYEFSSVASDMESPREGWFVSDFISVAEGKVYISGKSTGGGCKLYNKDKLFVKNIQATSGQLTIEEGISYFRLNGETKDLNNIQVELGSVSTTYEPYRKLQTLTLALDQPLRGIGEMKDELSESGILRRVKSIALNGSEKWYKYENSAFVAMNCYGLKIDDLEVRNYSLTTLCNFFKWARFPQDIESQAAHGGYIYFTVPKETCPDLESFKGWLAKNTPILEYQLKEPVLEELSEEDKTSIRALKTYYPTTAITADGGEPDPDIKVTYTADTKNYIDGKVSAKVASILRQYQADTANLLSLMPMETQATMIENDTNRILENVEEMKYE